MNLRGVNLRGVNLRGAWRGNQCAYRQTGRRKVDSCLAPLFF
ncbi:hypothetical protein ACFZAI_21570 [Achromobacter sp. NPDC008082]